MNKPVKNLNSASFFNVCVFGTWLMATYCYINNRIYPIDMNNSQLVYNLAWEHAINQPTHPITAILYFIFWRFLVTNFKFNRSLGTRNNSVRTRLMVYCNLEETRNLFTESSTIIVVFLPYIWQYQLCALQKNAPLRLLLQ